MKITFGRIFEQSLVNKTRSFEELAPYIEWTQQAIDNIARAITGEITFDDNIKSQYTTQTIRSQANTLEFKLRAAPKALILAQQSPVAPIVTSFAWQQLTNGNTQAIINLSATPANSVTVTLLAIY